MINALHNPYTWHSRSLITLSHTLTLVTNWVRNMTRRRAPDQNKVVLPEQSHFQHRQDRRGWAEGNGLKHNLSISLTPTGSRTVPLASKVDYRFLVSSSSNCQPSADLNNLRSLSGSRNHSEQGSGIADTVVSDRQNSLGLFPLTLYLFEPNKTRREELPRTFC